MKRRNTKGQQPMPAAPAPIQERRIEVVRGFTRKVNLDRFSNQKTYESVDFFMSAKSECAPADRADVSADLYQFCRGEVSASIREFVAEIRAHQAEVGRRELPSIEQQEAARLGGVA